MRIGIYQGPGASRLCVEALCVAIRRHLSASRIVRLDPASWQQPAVFAALDVLVMPGGRDVPYVRRLGRNTAQKIRHFVRRGGRYLGSCAGAYFAARRLVFAPQTPLSIVGPRPVRLWPGTASGPHNAGPFAYRSELGASAATLISEASDQAVSGPQSWAAYTNGGCAFVGDRASAAEKVWARYRDGSLAAVGCRQQRGRVVLWGLHPELEGHHVRQLGASEAIAATVEACAQRRHAMLGRSLRWLIAP